MAVIFVLVLTNIWAVRSCTYHMKESKIAHETIEHSQTRIIDTLYDTITNTTTVIYKPVVTTKDPANFVSKGLADTLAKALKVAVNKIERLEAKIISIQASGKGERSIDTTTKAEWLMLNNDPTFDVRVNLTNDSIYPTVRLRLMQAYAPYKKNIFSRTEYRSVIRANDARVRITDIQEVNKVPKSPRWGISAFGGPMVSNIGLNYGFGVGLTYDIIQF